MPRGIYKRNQDHLDILDKARKSKNGKPPRTAFKKGIIPWNKGKKMSQEYRDTVSKTLTGLQGPCSRNWKGGEVIDKLGYVWIYCPEHPFTIKNKVRKHRLVMEKYLGRYLTKKEVVHHINGDTLDNRIENLKLFNNHSDHMKHHHPKGERFKKKSQHFSSLP